MTRLFGTNGVRGVVGKTLTPELAMRLGRAVGSGLQAGATIAVGRDARTSGPMLLSAFVAGVQSTGVHVVDHGILPTPALQYMVKTGSFAAGVIITASHNPPEYNGIKLVAPDGTETTKDEEDRVEQIHFGNRFRSVAWDKVGTYTTVKDAIERYVAGILTQVDAERIRKAKLKVVLDAGGGAGCIAGVKLLKELGVKTTKVACEYDGAFTTRPSEPVEANATLCKQQVLESGADLGVLLDGDSDRAVFITETGQYVWGDQGLAVLVKEELRRAGGGLVCTPVSTSTAVADIARMNRGEVFWTPVGSPIVAREMIARNAVAGGEDNGGIIVARHQYCRDALMAVALMLDTLARTKRTLGDLVEDVPRYALWKDKIHVPDERKEQLLDRARIELPTWDGVQKVDTMDGVKAYFEGGWVLVRPSGTEPIFRVQAEGKDEATAKALGSRVKVWLQECRGPVMVI